MKPDFKYDKEPHVFGVIKIPLVEFFRLLDVPLPPSGSGSFEAKIVLTDPGPGVSRRALVLGWYEPFQKKGRR